MKKIICIVSLVVCMAFILCGCRTVSIKFNSIQCDSEVTFVVSGVKEHGLPCDGVIIGGVSGKSEEEIINELEENNNLTHFCEYGNDFLRLQNGDGVYLFDILPSNETNITCFRICDMGCDIIIGDERIERFPFPYFLMQSNTYENIFSWMIITPDLIANRVYTCESEKLLSLVKTLGIWEVQEKENSFIMSFKENSIEVVYGDGTVTLQPVA